MSEEATPDEAPLGRPSLLLGAAHLAALWSLAVLQPLLNLLGSTPEFFVARDNTPAEISVFVILVALLPPLVALVIEAALKLVSDTARWIFHMVLIATLFAILSLVFLKALVDLPAGLMIGFAVVFGIALAFGYDRTRFLRSLSDILIPAPLIILFAFFVLSDSSKLTLNATDVEPVKAAVSKPAPVVMVIFDEFPAGSLMTTDGRINRKRFPNFARLADTSSWYRDTTTDASYTTVAIPSLLSGQPVDRDSLPTARDHPDNLFTLLGNTYDVHAVEPITQLCPDDICTDSVEPKAGFFDSLKSLVSDVKVVEEHLLLPMSMTANLPDISQTFSGFGGTSGDSGGGNASGGIGGSASSVKGESIERNRARQWIDARHSEVDRSFDGGQEADEMLAGLSPGGFNDDRPTLNFGHVEEPHYPWNDYPNGMRYGDTTEDFRAFIPDEITWSANRWVTDRATQAHLLEVGYVDWIVGRIIRRLKQNGQWDQSLVVFTADHGGALLPDEPRRDANAKNIGEIATVPLFIKAPGQTEGEVVTRPTCSTEVLPTMAGILGVEIPWKVAECNRDEVSVDNGTGPEIKAPMDEVMALRQEYVERVARLFGDNTGWNRVLKLGPNEDLIGRGLDSFPTIEDSDVTASPDESGEDRTGFQPDRRVNLVLRQRGNVQNTGPDLPLAVSVNGTIVATGQTYVEAAATSYSMLLPLWSLEPGENDIRLYEVRGTGNDRTLARLQLPDDQ